MLKKKINHKYIKHSQYFITKVNKYKTNIHNMWKMEAENKQMKKMLIKNCDR